MMHVYETVTRKEQKDKKKRKKKKERKRISEARCEIIREIDLIHFIGFRASRTGINVIHLTNLI